MQILIATKQCHYRAHCPHPWLCFQAHSFHLCFSPNLSSENRGEAPFWLLSCLCSFLSVQHRQQEQQHFLAHHKEIKLINISHQMGFSLKLGPRHLCNEMKPCCETPYAVVKWQNHVRIHFRVKDVALNIRKKQNKGADGVTESRGN